MADPRWLVTMDGKQLEGEMSVEEVRTLLGKNKGKNIVVWTQGMPQWADPSTLPEFRKMPGKETRPEAQPKISADELKAKAGLLKGLLDFRFTNLISTKIVPVLYIISLAFIVLAGLFYVVVIGGGSIVTGVQLRSFMPVLIGIGIIILTPIVMLLYLAAIRLWFELVILFFRIKEDLGKLVERSATKDEAEKKL